MRIMEAREESLRWWNEMNLELQFYATIKNNTVIVGDKTRHPHTLTGLEIEKIYLNELKAQPYRYK